MQTAVVRTHCSVSSTHCVMVLSHLSSHFFIALRLFLAWRRLFWCTRRSIFFWRNLRAPRNSKFPRPSSPSSRSVRWRACQLRNWVLQPRSAINISKDTRQWRSDGTPRKPEDTAPHAHASPTVSNMVISPTRAIGKRSKGNAVFSLSSSKSLTNSWP